MSDRAGTLLTICRRLVDPDARAVALHTGHNDTAVLRATTNAGDVIVKCHRSQDRHRQEVRAYQHWTPALGAKAPKLIAVSEEPPGIGAHAERLVTLHGQDVGLRFDDEAWSGVTFGDMEPFDGLFLWLATVLDRFCLLSRARTDSARELVDPASPITTMASCPPP